LDSASPSARLICNIFSASAFSFAATLSLAAAHDNGRRIKIELLKLYSKHKFLTLIYTNEISLSWGSKNGQLVFHSNYTVQYSC
jgi:hypothetical protein